VLQGIGALKEKAREAREEVKVEVQQEREGRRERMEIIIRELSDVDERAWLTRVCYRTREP
jgi:hypothetical protein